MLNALREFVLVSGRLRPGRRQHPGACDPGFRIAPGGTSHRQRQPGGTFDWLLLRAGLSLEHRTARGTSNKCRRTDSDLVAVQDASPARPGLAPMTPRIGRRAASAAPLAVPGRDYRSAAARAHRQRGGCERCCRSRATSVQTRRRALNADDKTIAALTFDQMELTQPRRVPTPLRIAVSPLRGYQAQASRLADALAEAPGIALASHSTFESALRAAGRRPGDYTSKIDVQLTADMPAALANGGQTRQSVCI